MRRHPLVVAGVAAATALAAVNFLLQLGSSSYFVDEVLSVEHSSGSWHAVLSSVSHNELTPWPYFLFLHAWMSLTGSQVEWVLRLPSALAAVALIPAIYWAARQFVAPAAALLACGLAAVSPLLLWYSQQARVYTIVTLVTTLAVASTVAGVRRIARRRRPGVGLFWVGAVLAAGAIWLDYVAVFIAGVLCVWVLASVDLGPRRFGYVALCAVAGLVAVPLFAYQAAHNPPGIFPGSWGARAVHLLAGPFDARSGPVSVGVFDVVGVLVLLVGIGVVLGGQAGERPRLLVALTGLAPVGLLVAGIVDHTTLVSRYASVAAPFGLIVVAAAIVRLLGVRLRPAAIGLAVGAAAAAMAGVIASHHATGFYPPTRPPVAYVAGQRHSGDVVVLADADPVLGYYVTRLLPGVAPESVAADPGVLSAAVRARRRVWLLAIDGGRPSRADLLRATDYALASLGYRVDAMHVSRGNGTGVAFRLGPVH